MTSDKYIGTEKIPPPWHKYACGKLRQLPLPLSKRFMAFEMKQVP
ncbi:hypothetical protein Bbad01_28660 [Bacillus badius]|nr:hypothetical protein Bbad01_28660 [Bacillus badius]